MKRVFCGVFLLVLSGLTMSAQAIGDRIRFSQAASGAISAVLAGLVDPCSGSNHFPWGPTTTVSLSGNEFVINTFFVILDPRGCPDSGQPYEVTISLGNLGDGQYSIVWTVVDTFYVRGTFDVRSALLVPSFYTQSDCLFSWAETAYPTLFVPAAAVSNTSALYYYRYYSQTRAYLGTSSADNHVYYLGPNSGNSILDVGALSYWLPVAGCQ